MKSIDLFLKNVDEKIKKDHLKVSAVEYGEVIEIKDEVISISGLKNVSYGEVIQFENGVKGYVVDLDQDKVGAVVLGNYLGIKINDRVVGLKYTLSVKASDKLIGRVIDPLGEPLDGKPAITSGQLYPVEKIAPGVVKRQPVSLPLQTGIKAIDSLIPVGRGQRELIIGDRGTGKTTLAVDAILNQSQENVICIYCAIGQKNSKVASVVELLKKHKAMDYTIVVSASSSDPIASQYLAPYSSTAIAEYFMDKGHDVLIVYDDLTKHAWSYRQISLILRRPAGREAYPGDIFYLHSRLLERSCRLNEKSGGGSITALPIIETLEGDLSTYIPTNVISITDGQIFLETDLFNSGVRPAINVGASVSRVGGNAQTKAVKKVAGKLKLDLAQYRYMAAFAQFEGELDEETKKFLSRGARLTQILIQNKNAPYSLGYQVALIHAAHSALMDNLPVSQIRDFETKLVNHLRANAPDWITRIHKTKVLEKKDEEELSKIVAEII